MGEGLTAYGFATYSHKNSDAENFFDPPTSLRNNYGSVALARFPDGRVPITRYTLEDYAVTGGLRYETEQLGKFDLALNHGDNSVKSTDRNAINPSWGPAARRRSTPANARPIRPTSPWTGYATSPPICCSSR